MMEDVDGVEREDTDLAPDADEPGDNPPEDLLMNVSEPPDVPDEVNDPTLKRDDRCIDEAESTS